MDYKYREGELIAEFKRYIDSTYQQHYVTDGKQTMDSIIANGHGTGFCLGNVDKYKIVMVRRVRLRMSGAKI